MSQRFADQVYPVVIAALDTLERINTRRGGEPSPGEVRPRIRSLLAQVTDDLTRRALVYWVDDLFVFSRWSHAAWWEHNTLEWETYRTHNRATHFFANAKEAQRLGSFESLEAYYLAVALGFRGIYRKGELRTPQVISTDTPPPGSFPIPPITPAASAPKAWPVAEPTSSKPSAGLTFLQPSSGGSSAPEPAPAAAPPSMGMTAALTPTSDAGSMLDPAKGGFNPAEFPPTLDAWVAAVGGQVAPRTRAFDPGRAPDSQRDATPLSGWTNLRYALQLLAALVVVTGLLAIWALVG